MVERRAGADQLAHDLDVAEMRRGDQRGAVVAAGDVLRAAAQLERDLQRRQIVRHRGDGDDVVAVVLQRVGIGARRDERAHRVPLRRRRRRRGTACVRGRLARRDWRRPRRAARSRPRRRARRRRRGPCSPRVRRRGRDLRRRGRRGDSEHCEATSEKGGRAHGEVSRLRHVDCPADRIDSRSLRREARWRTRLRHREAYRPRPESGNIARVHPQTSLAATAPKATS